MQSLVWSRIYHHPAHGVQEHPEPTTEIQSMSNNNPQIPLPYREQLDTALTYTPSPIHPIARAGLNWLYPGGDSVTEKSQDMTPVETVLEKEEMERVVVPEVSGRRVMDLKLRKGQPGAKMERIIVLERSRTQPIDIETPPRRPRHETEAQSKPKRPDREPVVHPKQFQIYQSPPLHSQRSKTPSPFIITGSEYLPLAPKIRVHSPEQPRMRKRLDDALSSDMFKMWPLQEYVGAAEEKGRVDERESPVFEKKRSEMERWRGEEIAREWKEKEERSIVGRRRMEGGCEDVVEVEMLMSLDMFRPTLEAFMENDGRKGSESTARRSRERAMEQKSGNGSDYANEKNRREEIGNSGARCFLFQIVPGNLKTCLISSQTLPK